MSDEKKQTQSVDEKEKDQELNLEDLEDVSGVLIFRNSRARYQHHEAIVRKKSR